MFKSSPIAKLGNDLTEREKVKKMVVDSLIIIEKKDINT